MLVTFKPGSHGLPPQNKAGEPWEEALLRHQDRLSATLKHPWLHNTTFSSLLSPCEPYLRIKQTVNFLDN